MKSIEFVNEKHIKRENNKHNLSCGKYEIILSIKKRDNTMQYRIEIFTDMDKNVFRKHVQWNMILVL